MQWAAIPAGCQFGVKLSRPRQSLIRCHRDEGIEPRVESLNPRQVRSRDVERRQLLRPDSPARFIDRQLRRIGRFRPQTRARSQSAAQGAGDQASSRYSFSAHAISRLMADDVTGPAPVCITIFRQCASFEHLSCGACEVVDQRPPPQNLRVAAQQTDRF